MPQKATCPICMGEASGSENPRTDTFKYECPRCGNFEITFEAQANAGTLRADLRPYVSAATRQAWENGGQLKILYAMDLEELAEAHRRTRVSEKLDKLLAFLARKTVVPGTVCVLRHAYDYPISDARDEKEFLAYIEHLVAKGLVHVEPTGGGPGEAGYEITIEGWRQLEPALQPGGEPGRCFVATWLDDQMDEPYQKGIEPALKACGYNAVWMKLIPENKGITDRILSEIRRAEFVVADFTGQRQSVYFEAGFARGLGREVIWCCKDAEVANLHFDTKHFGHVIWKDAADLRNKLEASIRANIIKKA